MTDILTPDALASLPTLLILASLAIGTLVSEDLACVAAGLLVARGLIDFLPATAACLAGIYAGDVLLFAAGRFLGARPLRAIARRWSDAVERGRAWFARRGAAIVFISRFVPGTRLPAYLAAGALGTSFRRFSLWFLAAAAIWTPALVGSVALTGTRFGAGASIGLAAVLLIALRLGARLFDWKARRLLLSRWRRLTRWEFWPSWAAYLPLVPYLVALAIRHRSLTCFTAVNPSIPAGGVVGESKFAILQLLHATPDVLPKTRLVRRLRFADAFPVVLKPDVGQRGEGVTIARNPADVARYFASSRGLTIVQEYVEGPEFGVFYVRYPGEARGRITSITEKRMAHVTGDGRRTIEELILADDRAVALAPVYFERLGARRREIPAAGERVQLVDIGTHCRGAIFLDGRHLLTPELEAAVDRVGRAAEGFYFGRFDVRSPSIDDFRAGRFKVLELNGVTSEPTHIYHPAVGIVDAYRALFDQWRMAFAIGSIHLERGATTTSLAALARRFLAWRQLART